MTVVHWPKHYWARCEKKDCTGCVLCRGGLAFCTRCRGGEGDLPTDCPGVPMTEEQKDAVYEGSVDFRDGEWKKEVPIHCPETPGRKK